MPAGGERQQMDSHPQTPEPAAPASPLTAILTPSSWTEKLPVCRLFQPPGPLEVDIGCGKARFLLARAAANPGTWFLGIDRMLTRLRKADNAIQRAHLTNIRLLRVEASYAVTHLIPDGVVAVYYIFFPDPWPKRRHHPRRLFSPPFIDDVHRTLADGGVMHAATDHMDYFAAIGKILDKDPRFRREEPFVPGVEERTDFERKFLGQGLPIGRASFRKLDATRRLPAAASPMTSP